LEATLGSLGASATAGAASVVGSGAASATAAVVGKAAATVCESDPEIESQEARALDVLKQLNRMAAASGDSQNASQVVDDFFKANGIASGATALPQNIAMTPGISADLLQVYRDVAEEAIAAGKDTLGVQAARIDLIDRALAEGVR
jgi:hypothetical protein